MEFSDISVNHVAFAWDSIEGLAGDIAAFEKRGYYFEYDDIMVASEVVKPDNLNSKVVIRSVLEDREWDEVIHLNIKIEAGGTAIYAASTTLLIRKYRELCFARQCTWMGAYIEDKLVADLGLFHAGKGRGLAAMVKTHPDYRRQGICRTLLYEASLIGFEQMNFDKIVMVADRAFSAGRVYADVGYKPIEKGASLILNSL